MASAGSATLSRRRTFSLAEKPAKKAEAPAPKPQGKEAR
jgi:hypothetical protein